MFIHTLLLRVRDCRVSSHELALSRCSSETYAFCLDEPAVVFGVVAENVWYFHQLSLSVDWYIVRIKLLDCCFWIFCSWLSWCPGVLGFWVVL